MFRYTAKAQAFNLIRSERVAWISFGLFAVFWEGMVVALVLDGPDPSTGLPTPVAIWAMVVLANRMVLGCYLLVSFDTKYTRKIYRHFGDSIVVEGRSAWVQRDGRLIPAVLKQPAKSSGATLGRDLSRMRMCIEVDGEDCLYDPTSMEEIMASVAWA